MIYLSGYLPIYTCIHKKSECFFIKGQQAERPVFILETIAFYLIFSLPHSDIPHRWCQGLPQSQNYTLLFSPVRTVISEGMLYQGFLQVFGWEASWGKYFVWRYLDVLQTVQRASLHWGEGGNHLQLFFHEKWQIFRMCLTASCWISYPGEKFWLCRSPRWCFCQLPRSQAVAGLMGAGRGSFLPRCSGARFEEGISLWSLHHARSLSSYSCSSPFHYVVEQISCFHCIFLWK